MRLRLLIAHRFALLAALAVVLVVASVGLALYHVRAVMLEQKRLEIRNTVEAGATVMRGYVERAKKGEITEEVAKREAAAALRAARFDSGNYYFIYDFDGNTVMHPIRKDLEGKNLLGLKDKNGTPLIADMAEIAKGPGAGFTEFLWVKPGDQDATLKVSYTVGVPEWKWFIGSGLHVYDIDAALVAEAQRLAWQLMPVMAAFMALAWVIGRSVSKPLRGLTASMKRLAAGDFEARIAGKERADEVGEIARAVEAFRANLQETAVAERARELHAKEEAERIRRETLATISGDFEARVKSVADRVLSAAEAMMRRASEMTFAAENARTRAGATRQASAATQQTVSGVATASEQMTGAVNEIAHQVGEATMINSAAVREVEAAQAAIGGLAEASAEVGNVVRLIRDIAEQTNLLALNATIEAARAGEAGRGFAVVASEVKNLAGQTSRATEDISERIAAIQAATGNAVQAVSGINATIARIAGISTAISAAVEEQNASTSEIGHNVGSAARMMDEVSAATSDLANAADEAKAHAEGVATSAATLADEARVLEREVGQFLQQLRAA